MIKKILSNTFLYGIAPQLVALLNIVLLPFITPFLTAEDYGIYGIIMAFSAGIGVMQFLGLDVVVANAYFNHKQKFIWIWRKALGVLLLWQIPFQVAQFSLLLYVIPIIDENLKFDVILLTIITSIFNATLSFFGSMHCYLTHHAKGIFYRVLIAGILTALVNYYLIVLQDFGFLGWFYGNTIGAVVMGLSYFPLFIKLNLFPIFSFQPKKLKQILKVGVSTLPHHYATYFLESSDRILLDFMKVPINEIGRYNLGNSIGTKIFQMSKGISLASEPLIIKLYQERKIEIAQKLINVISILFLLGTFLICIWTKEIFNLLIKSEGLDNIYPLAIIIIMAMNFRPYYVLFNVILEYKEKTYLQSKLSLVIALVNIIANLLLIPIFGIYGAAFTTFFCYLVFGFGPAFLPVFKEEYIRKKDIVLWLIIIPTTLFLALELKDITLYYKVLITSILIVLALVMIKLKKSIFQLTDIA